MARKKAAQAAGLAVEPTEPTITQEVEVVEVKPNRNSVTLVLLQDTTKKARRKNAVTGEMEEYQKPVKHHMAFGFDTIQSIESERLSNWLIAQLYKYQLMQKAQGKAAFDTSLPIELAIKVNNNDVQAGIKFSTNAKSLERILNNYPTVVSMVFNPQSFEYGLSKQDVLQFAKGVNTVIANEIGDPVAQAQLQLEEGAKIDVPTIDEPALN